ncbi:MAG: SNF2-related protein, partial [Thermodesulfobacteriota bacterium]
MTTPMEELSNVESVLTSRRSEKSEVEKEIDKLQAQVKKLVARRDSIRTEIAQDIYKTSQLARQIQLYKREQDIEKELVRVQTVVDDLIGKEFFWGKSAKQWQIEGAVKLGIAKRGLLGDKRGLGKTLSSFIWRRAIESQRTLVLAPKRLVHNYITEAFKWEPDVAILPVAHSNAKERFNQFEFLQDIPEFIVIANYESWRKNPITLEQLKYMNFDALVLDEAHHLMTSTSKAAQGVKQLSEVIEYLLAMTGTPIMNRPQDLWIQLNMIAPDVFPNEKDFLRDYCYPTGPNRWEWRAGSLEKLTQEVLSKFILIRKREDVGIDIPPPAIIDYELDFDGYPLQEEAYQLLTERAVAILESGKALPQPSIMTIIMRQRQMVSWPAGIIF